VGPVLPGMRARQVNLPPDCTDLLSHASWAVLLPHVRAYHWKNGYFKSFLLVVGTVAGHEYCLGYVPSSQQFHTLQPGSQWPTKIWPSGQVSEVGRPFLILYVKFEHDTTSGV
jgi:hypothetical protein